MKANNRGPALFDAGLSTKKECARMNFLNVDIPVKNVPELDKGFVPLGLFFKNYQKGAAKPLCVAVERSGGQIGTYETKIYGTPEMEQADAYYVDRLVKFLLWSWGGFKVSICGDDNVAAAIRAAYSEGGSRAFDKGFMEQVYETEFIVESLPYDKKPEAVQRAESIGRHLDGGRIGFDAGGSDRKVSAVIDGECAYSEEVVWFPKLQTDPQYHYDGIVAAFRSAASKMPRVDAIGVSSAGTFIGNAPMVASLFIKVPRSEWDKVKTIYDRAAKEIGDVPIVVANDGDVSALAGAMGLGVGNIMGIAMGTSEAVGYVDKDKNVLGWINELAFAPVDLCENAMQDEWSTDIGVGCKYFSQDAVIKLAPAAGIELDENLSPAEKLKVVQALMEKDDPRAQAIFESIGAYLAYAVVLYSQFYDIEHMMMLGRVMSGKGGDTILRVCNGILADEYPALAKKCEVSLPDEKTRRVGQSVAAASLPRIK